MSYICVWLNDDAVMFIELNLLDFRAFAFLKASFEKLVFFSTAFAEKQINKNNKQLIDWIMNVETYLKN